jgi:hypothetical protein
MTAIAHSALSMSFNPAGTVLPIAGAAFWATSPSSPVLHAKLAPSGSATIICCSLIWLPGHYKCSLPAQFPMKSVATATTDGLGSHKTGDSRKGPSATVRCAKGRPRTTCAIDATVAGAVLR